MFSACSPAARRKARISFRTPGDGLVVGVADVLDRAGAGALEGVGGAERRLGKRSSMNSRMTVLSNSGRPST
jgi:hypothetical protein